MAKDLPTIVSIEGSEARDVLQINFSHLVNPRFAINAVSRLLRENSIFFDLDVEEGVIITKGSISYPLDPSSETYRFQTGPFSKTLYLLRTRSSGTSVIYNTLMAAEATLASKNRLEANAA
jgi:uncharacterized membrane protein YcaP (DUF421 family)